MIRLVPPLHTQTGSIIFTPSLRASTKWTKAVRNQQVEKQSFTNPSIMRTESMNMRTRRILRLVRASISIMLLVVNQVDNPFKSAKVWNSRPSSRPCRIVNSLMNLNSEDLKQATEDKRFLVEVQVLFQIKWTLSYSSKCMLWTPNNGATKMRSRK